MDTKCTGDIAEGAAVLHALRRGFGVLKPVGDRLPYDVVFDVNGVLVRVQVKCAWFDKPAHNYVIDNRRTKTNRRQMKRAPYGSEIHMVESIKRQRKPRSATYRDAWKLILQWASRGENRAM